MHFGPQMLLIPHLPVSEQFPRHRVRNEVAHGEPRPLLEYTGLVVPLGSEAGAG